MEKAKKCVLKYSIELLVYALIIAGLAIFYKAITVPLFFSYEFFAIPITVIAIAISIIFLFVTTVFFVIDCQKSKNNENSNSHSKSTFIIPIVFLISIQLSWIIPVCKSEIKFDPTALPLIKNSSIEKLENDGNAINSECISQSSFLGTVANWDMNCIIPDENNNLTYSCYYRQSKYPSVYKKFWKYNKSDFIDYKKTEAENYTLYYEDNGAENTYYALEIDTADTYFISEYYAYGDIAVCDYSLEKFTEDSLNNYKIIQNQ